MPDNRAIRIRELVLERLGDTKEARAFGNGVVRAADQYHRIRLKDVDAPDRKVQRARLKKLAKLLRELEYHAGTFTWHDWRNLGSGAYQANQGRESQQLPTQDLDELARLWLPALANAAESGDQVLARPGRPLDTGLWVFLYWAIHDYEMFFQKPDLSDGSVFVALIDELMPVIEPAWEQRDALSALQTVAGKPPPK